MTANDVLPLFEVVRRWLRSSRNAKATKSITTLPSVTRKWRKRIVWQKYLGKLEDIVAKMSFDSLKPYAAHVFQLVLPASSLRRLQLVDG